MRQLCSITGEEMKEGYVTKDGKHIKYESDLIAWIKLHMIGYLAEESTDEFLLKESYMLEEYDVFPNEIPVKDACILNENKATIKFMYYANNFNYNWIEEVWSDNAHMCKHILSKWDDLNQRNIDGGTSNFFTLFMQLDDENRNILLDWIKVNYKG